MKLVVFSPLVITSAIGRVTTLVVRALTDLGHECLIVRTEQDALAGSPLHPCGTELISWTDKAEVARVAAAADALVYQIGNNYEYHCGALHWLPNLPGIVCLHDFVVAHLFAGWAQSRPVEAARVLREWYGDEAAARFFSAKGQQEFMEDASSIHPLTEWICAMAQGVISHSHWGMARVARACAGPVRVVPLPYDAPAAIPVAGPHAPSDEVVNVLTIGHANTNKRIESVIHAIASSTILRSRVLYRLCGRIEASYALKLSTLARNLGVELIVSGEMDDSGLQIAINEADIACCLRWPSFEAASATAIEGLLYGKAVIVTDTSFYSELPDECVRKIQHQGEVVELKEALEDLCLHPGARHAMAVRGQQWARRTFSAPNYATQITDFAKLAAEASPALQMVSALLTQLRDWGGSSTLLNAEEIAAPLELFGDAERKPAAAPLPARPSSIGSTSTPDESRTP